jgi:hypothetical protein
MATISHAPVPRKLPIYRSLCAQVITAVIAAPLCQRRAVDLSHRRAATGPRVRLTIG